MTQIKAGKFFSAPKNLVLVGHSFGSVVSNSLLATNPSIVDGAVLIGIGYSVPSTPINFEAWQPRLARLASPERWRQLDGGYVTWVDILQCQYVRPSPHLGIHIRAIDLLARFFHTPFYDPEVVEYAEANKQPFGLMETITIGLTNFNSPNFTGPVMVSHLPSPTQPMEPN